MRPAKADQGGETTAGRLTADTVRSQPENHTFPRRRRTHAVRAGLDPGVERTSRG